MPATEYQGSSVPFASIGRSILSIRRDQVHSVDSAHHGLDAQDQEELDAFQRRVADLFSDLANSDSDLLSLPWIRKLLDTFLICLEEFRVILFNHRPLLSRPPLDRLVADFFDRAVKSLDVCNALRDGVDHVRHWHKHLDIVSVSVPPKSGRIGDGQLRRARKALADLAILMLDDKDGAAGSVVNHRNRSFGRRGDHHGAARKGAHFRSLSWSVSRSWSAARQLQAIGNNLNPPRGNEIAATSGFAVPVYTMNSVLLFVMWALVAAIPCQDRGLQTHFSVPRSFAWAAAVMSLHERIVEESKKRERKNSNGLMKEIYQIDKCTRNLNELMDVEACGMNEEREAEVRQGVEELVMVCDSLKEGLDPLERQVREVFHRIVRSRTEGLDVVGRSNAE